MLWFFLSLITAISVASHDAWVKKWFSHLSAFEMPAYPFFFCIPLLALVFPFIRIPELDRTFVVYFIANLPVNAAGMLLYIRSIQLSPLSLTIPYLAFTPLFLIFTGYLFLDEIPNRWGIFGIAIICAGSYILNLDMEKWDVFSPLKAFFREPGSWMMLIVALIFSFGGAMGKKAILHSSPMFFGVTFFFVHNVILILIFWSFKKISIGKMIRNWQTGLIAGGLMFMHVITHSWAVVMTKAAYMISVKRSSVFFSLLFAGVVFKEEKVLQRSVGTVLMVAGAILISIKGG